MAKLIHGIFGTFKGSLRSVTGKRMYSKGIITSRVNRSSVTYSQSQLENQARMSLIGLLAKSINSDILKKSVFNISPFLSPYNWFIKSNYQYFDSISLLHPNNLQVSKGQLPDPEMTFVNVNIFLRVITVNWNFSGSLFSPNADDRSNILVYNITRNDFAFDVDVNIRYSKSLDFFYPTSWMLHDEIYIYLFFNNHNKIPNASITEGGFTDLT